MIEYQCDKCGRNCYLRIEDDVFNNPQQCPFYMRDYYDNDRDISKWEVKQ